MDLNEKKREAHPLSWPDGWVRVRIQDRKPQTAWKKTATQYRDALITEFERLGATSLVISSNVPLNMRGDLTAGIEPRDPGVAVYFTRKEKEDFSWQDALGIHDPDPTEERISSAYRSLAQQYHPDRPGGDIEMFKTLTEHRDRALAWVRGGRKGQEYVIACDQFREVRLNMAAIRMTIQAIRQIERCGTSSLLERAFKGFSALPQTATAGGVNYGAPVTA